MQQKVHRFVDHKQKKVNGDRGTALLILNLDTRWRWLVIFTLRLLPPPLKITPLYPLNRRLGLSEGFGEQKNFVPFLRFEPRIVSQSPVPIPATPRGPDSWITSLLSFLTSSTCFGYVCRLHGYQSDIARWEMLRVRSHLVQKWVLQKVRWCNIPWR